ncbi:hypothetical protein PCANC_00111 [Puccinia coronata f. sp. avenae]|uniref:Uncharacterized protein n=1 Tax=Puccinia coronata f. sp. avenae TaxID=200324 RepID=A0A2N5W8W5_9BASI|nr:hypothetical protein PCANC_00111 [Puccinia coronata f. sp. avenae]
MHGSQPPPYNANYPAGCRMSTDPVRHPTRPGIRPGTPGYAGSGSYPYTRIRGCTPMYPCYTQPRVGLRGGRESYFQLQTRGVVSNPAAPASPANPARLLC